ADRTDAVEAPSRDVALRAQRAADRASELAPDDVVVLAARVDALRRAGDGAAARSLAARLPASRAETAYALGALELAGASPSWTQAIANLRSAAEAEGTLGRARAALAYALARSGDAA